MKRCRGAGGEYIEEGDRVRVTVHGVVFGINERHDGKVELRIVDSGDGAVYYFQAEKAIKEAAYGER